MVFICIDVSSFYFYGKLINFHISRFCMIVEKKQIYGLSFQNISVFISNLISRFHQENFFSEYADSQKMSSISLMTSRTISLYRYFLLDIVWSYLYCCHSNHGQNFSGDTFCHLFYIFLLFSMKIFFFQLLLSFFLLIF